MAADYREDPKRMHIRIWPLVLLTCAATACSGGNATTTAPTTTTAAYTWSRLSSEYAELLTKDCSTYGADFSLEATCLEMLQPDMRSLQTSAQALPLTKTRTDLTQSISQFLGTLEKFSGNGCFTRPTAIECTATPGTMNIQHMTVKALVKRGVQQG